MLQDMLSTYFNLYMWVYQKCECERDDDI